MQRSSRSASSRATCRRENRGYDIESHDPHGATLRFIEVKGRTQRADDGDVHPQRDAVRLNAPDNLIAWRWSRWMTASPTRRSTSPPA